MIIKKSNKYFINIILILLLVLSLNYIKNISYFELENLKNLFNKKWLPKESIHSTEVKEIVDIMNKNNILNFRFSDKFMNSIQLYKINSTSENNYIYYRTITYGYPILFEKNSENVIFFKQLETIIKNCEEVDNTSKIILAKC